MVTEKLPEDCTKDELKRFLEGKGFQIHTNITYNELLQQTKMYLISHGKTRIFCPENSFFGVLRHYGRQAMDLVSTKSEPPVVPSRFQSSKYYVQPIPAYSISEFSDEVVYDEPTAPEVQEISRRLENVGIEHPRTPAPERTFTVNHKSPERTHALTPSLTPSDSFIEQPRDPSRKRVRVQPDISEINPQHMSLPRPQVQPSQPQVHSTQPKFQPRQPRYNFGQPMESSPFQNNLPATPQTNILGLTNESFSHGRYPKFTQKFDCNKVSIEDYLQSISRWKKSHNVNDTLAINTCLDNFVDIALANTIDGNLTSFEKNDFEAFTASLTEKLGRPEESWMDEFETMKRSSKEAPFTFLSRLSAALKKGHNINILTAEHKRIVLRRFVNGSHRQVREQLKLRNDLSFENCAEISRRIEEAFQINGGATVSINNIQNKPTEEQNSTRPKVNRYQTPPPRREPCHICHQTNHPTKHCFGNLASPFFSKEKFERFNQPKN